MDNDIVPFGKYKGQPIEVLSNDRQYCEWLMSQGNFLDRYSGIKTLIINNFKEPEDTPEHNKIQALFIKDSFCIAVLKSIGYSIEKISASVHFKNDLHQDVFERYPDDIKNNLKEALKLCDELKAFDIKVSQVKFETEGADVFVRISLLPQDYYQEIYKKLDKVYYRNKSETIRCDFTELIWNRFHFNIPDLRIEIKPMIGDDYPSVMRQMKANKCNVLFYSSYSGSGISEADMRKIFSMSNIYTSKLSELEEIKC